MKLEMKRLSKTILIALPLATLLAVVFRSKWPAQETRERTIQGNRVRGQIEKLEKLNSKERVALLRLIEREARETQAALITLLDGSEEHAVKCYAAYLLGRYYCESAIPILAENLTLEDKKQTVALWYWDSYPAAEALIRIGKASEKLMIETIKISSNAKKRQLASLVLREIEGPEISRFILQTHLSVQEDGPIKDNLRAALKSLQKDSDLSKGL